MIDETGSSRLSEILAKTVGPAPWYWETFPPCQSGQQRYFWTHHGDRGALGYLVSLGLEEEPDKPRLALNTYCRPFLIPEGRLGLWCPEGRNLRLTCFEPSCLKGFDLGEVAGWFKRSSERLYAATAPLAEFELPLALSAGMHTIEIPEEFQTVDELILPTSYPAKGPDDPAFALYVLYPQAGLVEVLPQLWFSANQYKVGEQWITRAARDPQSHRLFGECFGAGIFVLGEDGCRLDGWSERRS